MCGVLYSMANLTERAYELKGKTVLYIPGEDIMVGRCRCRLTLGFRS